MLTRTYTIDGRFKHLPFGGLIRAAVSVAVYSRYVIFAVGAV